MNCMAGELLDLPHGVRGMALNLEEDSVGAVLLGDYTLIREGDEVRRTSRIMSIPVGPELVGRVVNAIGEPIDGKGAIPTTRFGEVEVIANCSSVIVRPERPRSPSTPSSIKRARASSVSMSPSARSDRR